MEQKFRDEISKSVTNVINWECREMISKLAIENAKKIMEDLKK